MFKVGFIDKPVFCEVCGTMYDSKEGKSQKHKVVDALIEPKKVLKQIFKRKI